MIDTPSASLASNRPERFDPAPVPAIPDIESANPDEVSVEYSHYRTSLSRHRTELSEHRTDLSEFRTDLSSNRTEMSMRRTGMSFQRTRMSADRTLMSEIRTSLSLIGFGFTIYQTFDKLRDAGVIQAAGAPRNFGVALIALGVFLLAGGIVRHVQFATDLRHVRSQMTKDGLVHGESGFPLSVTLVTAIVLMALGIAAILGIAFDIALLG